MKRIILAAALAAAPLAAQAQDSSDRGSNAIEEGAQLFLRGLLEEVQPPLQELAGIGAKNLLTLQALVDEMGPAFAEVFEQIDSITYYQAPEILPNGDIVFRRNADAPAWTPAQADPERADPERAEPDPRPLERSDPGEVTPWSRPPPAVPENELRIDPSRDMEL